MADTSTLKNDAKKAAFEAAYKAALLGKPMSQGAVNKVYDQQINRDNKSTNITGGTPAGSYTQQNPTYNWPVDNRTTQQKFDDAQTAYDRYLASNEYKQKLDKVGRRLMRDDAKAKELNATVEHYRQQLQAEEDQRIMDADLKELESWSDEDRRNLDRYIAEENQHAWNKFNPMLGTQFDTYVLNPIVEKYGLGKVRQMAETVRRNQNAETMGKVEEEAQNTANNRPWLGGTLGSTASVPANLVGSLTGTLGYVVEAGQRTGRYSTLDPNNIGNLPSVYGETVISEVAQNIHGDEESTNWLRKLAALGYQGGMSALDIAARIAVSGGSSGVSSAIAASGAFSNGLRQYSQQGATPTQAAAMALTSAGLEYVTEKLPTEKVLSMFKGGNTKGAVREVLKQAFLVEPTSEEVNLFAGVAAETLILGDKSSAKQQIGEMVANGMSYEEAKAQYYKSLWKEAAQTYAVSAISGGLSSAGATVLGNFVNGSQQTETQQQAAPAAPAVDETKIADQVFAQTGAEYAERMPESEVPAPLTEGQQNLNNAIAELLGVKQEESEPINEKQAEHISLEEQGTETEVKGTGAAEQNFSGKAQYQDLLYEGNVQPDRATDARPMEVPKTDVNGDPVSAVAANVYGSKYTTDDLASEMESSISKGELSYMQISNDTATQNAAKTIENAGNWNDAYIQWHDAVRDGRTGAEMAARGAMLLNHAAEEYEQIKATGDKTAAKEAKQKWISILLDVRAFGTNTAQGLQAMRLIRELAPPDKLDFAVASVKRMASDMRLQNDVQIDEKLLNEYRAAETDDQRNEVMGKIQQNVADQIPSTLLDKWTALRYTNMLGNLKTQVRNFAGNVGSMIAYRVKDQVAAGVEDVVSLFSKNYTRQKAHFVSRKALQFGKDDFNSFKGAVNNGGKFSERIAADGEFEQGVMDKRRIFKSDAKNAKLKKVGNVVLAPMEGYRRATNWLMNNEYFGDEAFGRAAYARAMAGYLKSNGVKDSDLANVDSKLLDKARAYAVKEAQEATFKDNSALAQVASRLQKAGGIVGQGIVPFTKTPANVLTRAVEFSPAGILDTAVKSAKAIAGSENVTGADVVNSLAKTITGTGLVALGALLWDRGLLSGGPDEDDEKEQFDKMNGAQNYALQFQDRNGEVHSYTFDWLTPVVIPMFMGAELWKAVTEADGEATFADYVDLFTAIADPMIQMSMLQGLNDSLDGIKYTDNNLGQFFINATVSYLTQGLTNTLVGQIERSTEKNRQTTFVDKDSNVPQWLQKQLGKASQKIPGWDYQQTEYVNAWGETEENEGGLLYNLLSPGYISKEEATAVSNELYRLREATGENVFPQRPEKNLTYTDKNGERHENYNLTAEEYDTMQRAEGKTAARIIGDLTSNADYAALTDAQKAKVIGFAYDYAMEQGRVDAIADYKGYSENWMKNISGKEAKAIVNKVVGADLSNSMSAITNAWKNKYDTSEAIGALDAAYDVYKDLSMNARKAVKDDASGRMAAYLEARNNNLRTETFVELYKTYWELDNSRKKTSEKANEWAYTLERAQESGKLTEKQKDIMKDALSFSQFIPVEAAKFDEMTRAGLNAQAAQDTVKAISNLTPEEGYSQVRDVQTWDAICAMTIADTEKITAMRAYMTDKQEEKLDDVMDMGFAVEDYPEIYRIIDAYTSGTGKKARTIKYLQKEYGIEYAAAKKLYEVFK